MEKIQTICKEFAKTVNNIKNLVKQENKSYGIINHIISICTA